MFRLLSMMIILTVAVSCTQPVDKEKNTEKETDSKEIAENTSGLDKTVVAKVNGKPIYKYSLDQNLDNPMKEAIIREILIQKAENEGLVKKKDFSNVDFNDPIQSREMAQYIFSTDQLMRSRILGNVNVNKKISDAQVNEYYNNHIENYTYVKTLVYRVGADDETTAKVRDLLIGGSTVEGIRNDFEGKDLTISVEEKKLTNDPVILDSFDVLEVGSISKPMRHTGKNNIYKITEVKKVDIEKIKSALKQNIKSERKKAAIHSYVDNLIKTKEFDVEVLEGDYKG